MSDDKKKEQPAPIGPFAHYRSQVPKNNTGSLKPRRPIFAQKPVKKVTGRGR